MSELNVEELFANLLDWDTPKPKPAQQAAQPAATEQQQGSQQQQRRQQGAADGEGQQQQQPAAVDSKKLCGNVESDQPGRLQCTAWLTAVAAFGPLHAQCAFAGLHTRGHQPKACNNPHSNPSADLIGLDVWPASVALCTYLAAHPGLVAGAAVCELGAGARVVWLHGVLREWLLVWHACDCWSGGGSLGLRTSTHVQRWA